MTFLTFVSLWIFLLCMVYQSYTSGTGKVFIGFLPNSSLIQSGLFSSKASMSSPMYYLPVFVRVFDDVNGSVVLPLRDNVSIECETNINTTGFSMVSFSPLILSEGIPEGIVNISLIKSGRSVEVRCFGNSFPLNSSVCVNSTQFRKETSISDAWPLIVLPKPVVTISSRTIAVPNTINSFRVEFSEPVKDFPVIVSCNPVEPANNTEVVIFDRNVTVNSSSVLMPYFLTNGSITSPIKVSCTINQTRGDQFENTLPEFPIWFVPNEVDIDFNSPRRLVKSLIFETFLIPHRLSGEDIQIQCYSNTVHSQVEATAFFDSISCPKKNTATNSATTPANSSSTTRATTPVSSSATTRTTSANFTGTTQTTSRTTPAIKRVNPWVVINPNFTLKAEGATLELRRQLPVVEPTLELVTLTCCATLTAGLQVLRNRKLNLSVIASLQPFVSYNESELIPIDEMRATPIGNPAKKSFANCPCDMTWDNCDINCCCDKDCNTSDTDSFSKCTPGYQGGQAPTKPAWMCNDNTHDQNRLLCVHTQDSAFLGYYRKDKSAISDLHIFKTDWTLNNQFSKTDFSTPEKNEDFNYKYGSQIHTTIPKDHTHVTSLLTLPQRIFNGQCATTAPIRFLTDMNSDCIYQMTPDLCSDISILSATNFALSTSPRSRNIPNAYFIHNGFEQKRVQTDVNYYCASDPQPYLKSLETLSDVLARGLESSQNFTIPDACIVDSSGFYRCSDNSSDSLSTVDEDLPPRCSWDNGFTKPSTPTLRKDSNAYQCDNVVLGVQYHFTWSGSKIEFLNASVILGNISFFNVKQQQTRVYYSETVTDPLTNLTSMVSRTLIRNTTLNESTQLNPRYEVKYTHNFNNTKDNSSDVFLRSGNPGYNFGKPIWSGVSVRNETSDELLYVNRNETQQMNVWEPSPSGLCSLAGKRKIMFGEDLFSSCVVPLTIDSINDCQNLRMWLLYQLSLLMPSDRIGRYGSNDAQRSDDWIPVLRENLTAQFPDLVPVTESNSTNTTMQNSSSPTPTPTTTVGTTPPGTTEPTLDVDQNYFPKGTCAQVPSGIILDIMYANTGLVHGMPMKEIIGARARYIFDNWTFTCSNNVIGGSCISPSWNINDTERYQLFTLTSAVHFTQVPETRPKPIIRYKEMTASDKCWFETCIGNIISPIKRQPGEDIGFYMNKLAVTLIIVFFAFLFGFFLHVL